MSPFSSIIYTENSKNQLANMIHIRKISKQNFNHRIMLNEPVMYKR